MPLTPYMSPAAIGWIVVRFRGCPTLPKCSPMAASIASGHPSPLEELTVTTASSGISAAASAAERTRTRVMSTSSYVTAACRTDLCTADGGGAASSKQLVSSTSELYPLQQRTGRATLLTAGQSASLQP